MLMHEAKFYKALSGTNLQCHLCNRMCAIAENEYGKCGVRKNIDGTLYSLAYGKNLTKAIDPIEKKPLFHFMPGSKCLSVSTFGCNFKCDFCQNFDISQEFNEEMIASVPSTSPKEIVKSAVEQKIPGIAYTYTEPTIFAEYALDIMELAHKEGLYNVWVSNGYMGSETISEISKYLDAINIDLKGDEKFYETLCGNVKREFVLDNIKSFHEKGVHVEVTNLIVPGFNDNEKSYREISEFIKSISPDLPLHFSAFHPVYRLHYLVHTDPGKIIAAKKIAESAGLNYVYGGNIGKGEDTFCKKCKNLLITRNAFYKTEIIGLEEGSTKCKKCGAENSFIL